MPGDLFIAGTGAWLPEPMTVQEAEQAGLCEHRRVWNTGFASVCIATAESPPEMAVRAARQALSRATCEPDDVALVLHASAYYQGHDMWAPASYIQRLAVGNRSPSMEIRQLSNGGLAALELAEAYLLNDSGRAAALITTADRFCLPGYDRWRTDPGTVCGDGGTAMVLSAREGFAVLRSLETVSEPALEVVGRGREPFGDAPLGAGQPIDLGGRAAQVTRELGLDTLLGHIKDGQGQAIGRATREAGVKLSEIDWFVLPNMGRMRMRAYFFEPFKIDPERTTWDWGRHVGHLGAGDQFAGLDQLISGGRLRPGQTCMVIGVGSGFSWSAAIIEMTKQPRWAPGPVN